MHGPHTSARALFCSFFYFHSIIKILAHHSATHLRLALRGGACAGVAAVDVAIYGQVGVLV